METLARIALTAKRRDEDRQRVWVNCPYCGQRSGPWTGMTVEPCRICARPLYLSTVLNPRAVRTRASSVLDTAHALQGVFMIACFGAFLAGWMIPRQLGQSIAMAMFVAASGYTTDGVLGFRSGIVRIFGQVMTGTNVKAASIAKVLTGIIAFALSLVGILLFVGTGR